MHYGHNIIILQKDHYNHGNLDFMEIFECICEHLFSFASWQVEDVKHIHSRCTRMRLFLQEDALFNTKPTREV